MTAVVRVTDREFNHQTSSSLLLYCHSIDSITDGNRHLLLWENTSGAYLFFFFLVFFSPSLSLSLSLSCNVCLSFIHSSIHPLMDVHRGLSRCLRSFFFYPLTLTSRSHSSRIIDVGILKDKKRNK